MQITNLRYGRLQICATKLAPVHGPNALAKPSEFLILLVVLLLFFLGTKVPRGRAHSKTWGLVLTKRILVP